jgi:L-lactate dehydrogenase complex protein LldG
VRYRRFRNEAFERSIVIDVDERRMLKEAPTMSEAREEILSRLESARPPTAPRPGRMVPPPTPPDGIETLRERVHDAGGSFQVAERGDWHHQIEWPEKLSEMHHVYSALANPESRGVGRTAGADRDLERLDLCVIQAEFAVIENGAVWHIPSDPRERCAALLAQHLVVVVDASRLVPTLHEAYERIDLAGSAFGWFLCGPSKTADIEQSLVLGAHGPCTMSLVLLRDGQALFRTAR